MELTPCIERPHASRTHPQAKNRPALLCMRTKLGTQSLLSVGPKQIVQKVERKGFKWIQLKELCLVILYGQGSAFYF